MKVCHIEDIQVKDVRLEEYAAAFSALLSQLREAPSSKWTHNARSSAAKTTPAHWRG